ncbi:MAG TPA: aldo/keto reductase [Solirubrobacterales bacterium]|nr:aldo/keto reductase [Solirubrobacterales bacterium]
MLTAHTVTLGDREIKRIGLGTNRLTDTEANRSFLKEAVDAGLGFIDTAHIYTDGESEQTIGAALAPFSDDLVVATKAGYTQTELPELRSQVEQSFERLRTDRITLYYLHRVHPQIPIEESVGVLKEFVDAGRIDHVGLSEVSVEQITRAQAVTPIAAIQNEFNLGERKWDPVIDHCEAEGMVFVSFFPLRADSGAVAEVAERHGATANQVKLAWLLSRSPNVAPIPGTRSIEHLKENLEALDLELSDEDLQALD